jgi:hypothetical protein
MCLDVRPALNSSRYFIKLKRIMVRAKLHAKWICSMLEVSNANNVQVIALLVVVRQLTVQGVIKTAQSPHC